jgi:hypothetical protein
MEEYHADQLIEVLIQIKDELKDLNSNVRYVATNINDTYKNYENIERKLGRIAGIMEETMYK